MFYFRLNGETLPKECAIKVYKTTLNEFKNRGKYVDGDHRLKTASVA
jgi:RIO kinase 3